MLTRLRPTPTDARICIESMGDGNAAGGCIKQRGRRLSYMGVRGYIAGTLNVTGSKE